ncbi:DL-glycerol-3-phosphatase [Marasmius sp. AFHP31]|nr:DL-glycerol-3-phosphatase [Marasmius sp. AFHP31]
MPSATFHVDAALFDMDGTLVDSAAGVTGAWEVFKQKYPHINVQDILSCSHGVRTVENLKHFCGIEDPDELEREAVRFETAIVESSKLNGRQGIIKLPGVTEGIQELEPGRHLPNPCWAICTSATRAYATAALTSAQIPIPDVFVAAEDVSKGKPEPDPYLLGAKQCGVKPENCVVFEDAPNGIRSGKAAGCKTIGFLTTHSRAQMEAVEPDFLVRDMSSITFRRTESGIDITVAIDE